MTTKEKLKKALEVLKFIADGGCEYVGDGERYAADIYSDLTTPRTEEVEVKRWVNVYPDGTLGDTLYDRKADALNGMDRQRGIPEQAEITIKITRPIPEPETWEGIVLKRVNGFGQTFGALPELPSSWIGHRVVVEVL